MSVSRRPGSLNRRRFLKTAGAALVLPAIVPGSVFGQNRPSNKITMGVIGWGMQGPGNTKNFLYQDDCQVVAACDLDKHHLQAAVDTVNDHYQNKDCKAYHDYRELLAREDIDAVMIAVPDHWHALAAVEAARRKKDIYGEKPLAHTIAEQQAIVKAVEENGVIWQTGSWQRSVANFRKAAEIVRNGLIGNVTRVEVGLPAGHHDFAGTEPAFLKRLAGLDDHITSPAQVVPGTPAWDLAVTAPPPELDYNMWIGPSKMEPYIQARVHMNWRWNYNTGGGQLMDWIGHHGDIAHWGMGFDHTGPSEIEGHGDFPPSNAVWNTSTKYRIEAMYEKAVTGYPVDVPFTIAGGYDDIRSGTKWIGPDGWVWVDRGGFDASNPEWKPYKDLPDKLAKVKLYVSNNHWRNFLDCVKSRKPTITPVETAHHSTIPGHLGLISMLVGRRLRWDVKHEKILNDPAASKLLSRPYRAPWHLA
ncbi:MAG: Gfo/Idh/MocA family oxidoreductase [Verrucomicrobiota bacterium]|nr:Gfo/Idh/MocA family oxidoreductase [Verrucomicrobiota bacterium]